MASPDKIETIDKILDLFLAHDWTDRAEIFAAIKCNDIFCAECGMGELSDPNPNCQCWNDE